MKTEIEILAEVLNIHTDPLRRKNAYIDGSVEEFVKTMQEYAKQEAIEFARWLSNEAVMLSDGWWQIIDQNGTFYHTTEQLYKLYQDEKLTANKG